MTSLRKASDSKGFYSFGAFDFQFPLCAPALVGATTEPQPFPVRNLVDQINHSVTENAHRSATGCVQEAARLKTQPRGLSRRRFGVHHVPVAVQPQVGQFCVLV